MKAIHIELAIANYFGIRRHLIVPNVSWGLDLRHECDLLIVRESGFAAEVEIKVSKSDLKKDVEKRKWKMAERYGYSKKIKDLYFAVPENLADAAKEFAPEQAGILTVAEFTEAFQYWSGMVHCIRKPIANKDAQVLTASDQASLLRLAHMRIWGMKEKLIKAMEAVTVNDGTAITDLCSEDKDEFEMAEVVKPEHAPAPAPLFD